MKYLKLSSQIFSKLKQQVGKSDVKLKHCSKPLETTSVGTSLQPPHNMIHFPTYLRAPKALTSTENKHGHRHQKCCSLKL